MISFLRRIFGGPPPVYATASARTKSDEISVNEKTSNGEIVDATEYRKMIKRPIPKWKASTEVPCPLIGICTECIPYHQLQHHLLLDHFEHWRPSGTPCITTSFILNSSDIGFEDTDWSPKFIHAFDKDFVFMVTRKAQGDWYAWVWILGNAQDENCFFANIRFVKGKDVLTGKYPVRSYRLRGWDAESVEDKSSFHVTDATMKNLIGDSNDQDYELAVKVTVEIEVNPSNPPLSNQSLDACSGDFGCSSLELENILENSEREFAQSIPVECLFGVCRRWFANYDSLKHHLKKHHPLWPVRSAQLLSTIILETSELKPRPEWKHNATFTYNWIPKWIQAFSHDFFFMLNRKSPGHWFAWVWLLADPNEAKFYQSTIQFYKDGRSMTGEYPVYSVRIKEEQIAASGNCFSISDTDLKQFLEMGKSFVCDLKVLVNLERKDTAYSEMLECEEETGKIHLDAAGTGTQNLLAEIRDDMVCD